MVFFSTLMASAVIAVLAVPLLCRVAFALSLVDLPNERKVHQQPVPRVGGIAMAVGSFVPILFWGWQEPFAMAYLAGASLLVFFGFLDDRYDLAPRWKLLGQAGAACIAICGGGVRITALGGLVPAGTLLPWWLSLPLTLLTIVGVTNAINLSDGLDGLAGGISLLSLCCIGYLAYLDQNAVVVLIALAMAGATYGFLRFNTYPATVFMGDVGSQLLGYSAITLALHLTQGYTPLNRLLPLIILGFPVLDTLTVMTGRIARGRSPFSADKTHFHHSLLQLGLHQRESVLTIYLVQVALIAFAFYFRFHSERLLLAGYLVFSGLVLAAFATARRSNWQLKRLAPLLIVRNCLGTLRRDGLLIKYLFPTLEIGLFALLLLTTALCGRVTRHAAYAALCGLAAFLVIFRLGPRLSRESLRIILYLLIPLIVFRSAQRLESLAPGFPMLLYRLWFALLALLDVLVSLLTRRRGGFMSTPLDFLILFIALMAANVLQVSEFPVGIVAAKIMICYFSCEVVFAERREDLSLATTATLSLLALVVLQGVAGG